MTTATICDIRADTPSYKLQAMRGLANSGTYMIDTVVFDLDGTLVDTIGDITDALNLALVGERLMPASRDDVRRWVGRGTTALVAAAVARDGRDIPPSLIQRICVQYLQEYQRMPARWASAYPGVHDTLEQLSALGTSLAVCTNKPAAIAVTILEALNLKPYFPVVVGGDTLPQHKPDPRPLRYALAQLRGTRGRAALVGDSDVDVETAHAAGAVSVCVTFGYGPLLVASRAADLMIGSFDRLVPELAKLGSRS